MGVVKVILVPIVGLVTVVLVRFMAVVCFHHIHTDTREYKYKKSLKSSQSLATQSLHLSFWALRKIVACSHSSLQCLLVSTVFGMVSSLHPTSDFYTCFTNFLSWLVARGEMPYVLGALHVQIKNFIALSLRDAVQHIIIITKLCMIV